MRKGAQPIGDILSELMAKTGFARVQSGDALHAAWCEAAGELAARYTRVGAIKRGKLEVVVANSTLLQELSFRKRALVEAISRAIPEQRIDDLKFRLGVL
jgi:predicted nucleic acid-binding Zn ribbon protein